MRTVRPPDTPLPTIWYMGAKTRILKGFLDRVLREEVSEGGRVVDLFSGTGAVAAFAARHFRTISNDVQRYAQVLARSVIEHDPAERDAFLASLDPESDLGVALEANASVLEELYRPALDLEDRHLEALAGVSGGSGGEPGVSAAVRAYRGFLERPGAVYGEEGVVDPLYRQARQIVGETGLRRYRRDPARTPFCLVTVYYANIYYGLRQAIALDSLRHAIEMLGGPRSLRMRKQVHYLSALLRTASVCTSGTSHFAQPRHLRKDSEVLAVARRRRVDVVATFLRFCEELAAVVASIDHRHGNRALCGDYRELLEDGGDGHRFRASCRGDLVYVDPPYTSDNYSRFYHLLEVLAVYDYPELERDRSGRILRGRYPALGRRFQSRFCRRSTVEGEFDHIVGASARSGSKLVVSYGSPNGLLLKTYRERYPAHDPVEKLAALCRRHYRSVRVRRREFLHSGQGDRNIPTEELLVICSRPDPR